MTNSISTPVSYQFNNQEVRTQTIDSEAWFCLADVCRILEIKNVKQLSDRLNPKGICKIYTHTNGGEQELLFINEANFYKAVFRSNKPEARDFEDWVAGEVLPTLRRTGSYSMHEQPQLDAPSTKADREPLTNLVNSLVSLAPLSYRDAWHMVKAELKTTKKAAEFTVAEVAAALKFVQSKIDLYCSHDDIITEQALKGTKAFIVRISVEEPAKSKGMTLIQRQFKATTYITEEQAPHEISTRISHMLYVHHDK